MSWEKCTLADIVTIKKGEYITKKDAVSGKYPVILGGKEPAYYINQYNHVGKAIVISRSGASAGYVSFWNEPIFITDGFLIEPKQNTTHKFLFYLLKSKQSELSGIQRGAAIPHVTPSLINSINVSLPDLHMQNRIASILSAYDDLIENNQKQIKLLEEAAQRLYKEWFVDLRFPGWENTKIVDGVPEGWISRKISNLGNVITGKTPSTQNSSFYGKDIPFITIPDMHNFVFPLYTEKKLSNEGANSQPTKYIPAGSLLISCIATVGLTCISCAHCQTNQQINSIIPFQKNYLYYLYEFFSSKKEYLNNIGSSGATMINVNKSKIENIPVLLPSDYLLNSFHSNVQSIMDKILILQNQFYSLKSMQDTTIKKIFYRGD